MRRLVTDIKVDDIVYSGRGYRCQVIDILGTRVIYKNLVETFDNPIGQKWVLSADEFKSYMYMDPLPNPNYCIPELADIVEGGVYWTKDCSTSVKVLDLVKYGKDCSQTSVVYRKPKQPKQLIDIHEFINMVLVEKSIV